MDLRDPVSRRDRERSAPWGQSRIAEPEAVGGSRPLL
jgi:hypothetical protein